MTIEDTALRFEGLDPVAVHRVLDNVSHLLGVIKTEMPRIEHLIVDLRSQIAAYEAKQRQFGGFR